jgi:hypothetical protein
MFDRPIVLLNALQKDVWGAVTLVTAMSKRAGGHTYWRSTLHPKLEPWNYFVTMVRLVDLSNWTSHHLSIAPLAKDLHKGRMPVLLTLNAWLHPQ